MKMIRIKKIGVLSLAKVQAALMALVGLISYVVGVGLGVAPQGPGNAGLIGRGVLVLVLGGLLVIVLAPLFYGLIGFVFGALAAFWYNLAAGVVGGLEIELELAPPVEPLNVTKIP